MSNKTIDKMRKDELVLVANSFGVDVNEGDTKNEIIVNLKEAGVTDEMAQSVFNPSVSEEEVSSDSGSSETKTEEEAEQKESAPVSNDSEKVIVLMTRSGTYSGKGFKFTQNHPFQILPREIAERFVTKTKGFRQATESEVKSFYG